MSSGNKNLVGGTGNDYLFGGRGSDHIAGQEGDDLLEGGYRRNTKLDVISGGEGRDLIFVYHELAPHKDVVSCGDGRDHVLADRADVLRADCERVGVVHGSQKDVRRQVDIFYTNHSLQNIFRGIRWPQ